MQFDGLDNVNPDAPREDVEEGNLFPNVPEIGQLFRHASYGLCIYCHDSAWRKVIEQ